MPPGSHGPFSHITDLLGKGMQDLQPLEVRGRVVQVVGTIIKAVVPRVKIGELCRLKNPWEDWELMAEVVGFSKEAALLTPLGELIGVSSSTEVIPTGQMQMVPVGSNLLGRVLDGLGRPMDEDTKGPLVPQDYYPIYQRPPDAVKRRLIEKPISLGIRALDGMLTCGEGQRMGIFAAAGGGKSTILAQIIRNTEADKVVLALIGERGREVREFIERDLGEEGLARSVIVVSTSDRPSMERLKAAYVATSIAEYYRDQGERVLFLMDSVTRFARAQREIGLAAGEPPTRRGFPPSVFESLPKLMERSGQSDTGSITGLYTVLVEGDDMTEPVADETRSILDGHIILSRKLAAASHYPAIDILESVSRVMSSIIEDDHKRAASKVRELMSKYQEVELLVRIGEYKRGSDPITDEAIDKMPEIRKYLVQGLYEKSTYESAVSDLIELSGI
ncbi:MAG: EscN/YscN/HrcN family type III secretion system ATPase [Verrucomicrobia bacterium 21-51-4]|nr:MAG: EscN/YscN/HrcN family type III secretion system ATPase [Verrucomicrobia bacterium 21-51-4]HQU09014.1 type III secretion system ATPase SctN [Opitutales bacterium]